MALSIIEFQDPTGEILVSRVPAQGTGEFLLGSQLIVQDGQIAVFYRDGRPTDGFAAGRHTLNTQNLPVISKMVNLAAFGGKSPFRAYVYFIQLKTFINLGWGTQTPILFRDSEFKAVHLRAHGVFSIRLGDYSTFLHTIVGSQGLETTFAIQEFLRRIIASRLVNLLPSILTTVLDLPARYQEIEVGLRKAIHEDFNQYGLELVDLLVEAVTVPPEVQQMIDRAAGSRALGDSEVKRYQQVALADALRDASKQPGGEGLASAMTLGAGIGMGQKLGAGFAADQPQSTPPTPPNLQWYAHIQDTQVGPLNTEAFQTLIKAGQVTNQTLVWRQGMSEWTQAGQVPELRLLLGVPPPLPPQR